MTRAARVAYPHPRRIAPAGATALSDLSERLRYATDTAFHGSSKRLARALDCNQRRAQRWLAGDDEPPVEVIAEVEAIAALVTQLNAGQEIHELILRWRRAGLHIEAISAILAEEHEELTRRTIS